MQLDASISLSFNGECEAAFKIYERLLGAHGARRRSWATFRASGTERCCSPGSERSA
jgi:uncharacterized glyoxalase superfamily protein PhnB